MFVKARRLAAAVGVGNQASTWAPVSYSHLHSFYDQIPGQILLDRIAHDPSGAEVHDGRQVEPAFIGVDIGDVRYPAHVRAAGIEFPVQDVLRHRQVVLGVSGHLEFTFLDGMNVSLSHQSLDSLFAAVDALFTQLPADAGAAIGFTALFIDLHDLFLDNFILYLALAYWPNQPAVVCRPGHLEDPAHLPDTELARVLPEEPISHLGVLEKMAAAFLKCLAPPERQPTLS